MTFDTTPTRLEAAFVQRDKDNLSYEQFNISGSDLIIYLDSKGILTADKISIWAANYGLGGGGGGSTISASWASQSLSSSYIQYNGNRPITRTGYIGTNVGGNDLKQFIENFFFPFIPATISINSSTLNYETGTFQQITINGAITANSELFFKTGSIKTATYTVLSAVSLPSASTYSKLDPNVSGSVVYQTYFSCSNNGSPTIISSPTKTVNFIYPYLWGMSTTPGLSGNSLYTTFTRQIQTQGNKTVSLIGNVVYIYFCYPSLYPVLTSILDPNLFQAFSSFEYSASVPVTSSGLPTNWMTNYKVYRTKLVADPAGNFQFIY